MSSTNPKPEFPLQGKLRSHYVNRVHRESTDDFLDLFNLGAIQLYRYGREAYLNGDTETQQKCERLNFIINSCHLPSTAYLGEGTEIAYSGPGVLVHSAAVIGDWCVLGKSVTLAAAPTVGDHVYLSTGAQVVKPHVKIGSFCVIGANAVITKDIPACSVVAGVPGRIQTRITEENLDKYLLPYFMGRRSRDPRAVESVRSRFLSVLQAQGTLS